MNHRPKVFGRLRRVALLLPVVAAAALLLTAAADSATTSQTVHVGVFAGSDGIGQDSGVALQPGVPVTLTASGWFNCGGPGCDFDPNGAGVAGDDFLAPGLPSMSLIARVGDGPWTFVGDGPTTLSGSGELYFAVDDNYFPDNYGDGYTVVLTSSTPPVVTPTVTGTLGANGWYTSDVGVSWAVDEPIVSETGCDPTTVTADTAGQTLTCTATTAGGTTTQSVSVERDATPPTVAFTGNAGSYTVDQTVTIACTASDATSGVASSTCAQNGLTAVPAANLGVGTHQLSATATDNAGNTADGSTSFTVVATAGSVGNLTLSDVQSSPAYQALSPAAQTAVNRLTATATSAIAAIVPRLSPAQKVVFVQGYRAALSLLQRQGWLTAAQASTLSGLAASL